MALRSFAADQINPLQIVLQAERQCPQAAPYFDRSKLGSYLLFEVLDWMISCDVDRLRLRLLEKDTAEKQEVENLEIALNAETVLALLNFQTWHGDVFAVQNVRRAMMLPI